jgi:hypothetical protein
VDLLNKKESVIMFRKVGLIFLMCLLLGGAVTTGIATPVVVFMGGLTALAFFVTVARNRQQE